jgi:hypothetical protein
MKDRAVSSARRRPHSRSSTPATPATGSTRPRAIDALGAARDAIGAVIVTHHHADHAGTAERLRSTAGSRVLVGEPTRGSSRASTRRTRARASTASRQSGRAGCASSHTARCPEARTTDRSRASRRSSGTRRSTCPGRPRVITRPAIPRGTTPSPSPSAASCCPAPKEFSAVRRAGGRPAGWRQRRLCRSRARATVGYAPVSSRLSRRRTPLLLSRRRAR